MNVPTPLNDTARDDRFDRGLEQLLQANPAGLDEIEPELRDITVQMVQLANDAGWIGNEPGDIPASPIRGWFDLRRITNAVAAVALIGVVSTLAWFGVQYLNDGDSHFGSIPTSMPADVEPASCDRVPRSDEEIAAIVRSSEAEVAPFQSKVGEDNFYNGSLQLAQDWNLCLLEQNWPRALAYESDYFLWSLGQYLYPDGVSRLTNAEIVSGIMDFHQRLEPMQMGPDIELRVYFMENFVALNGDRNDGAGLVGVDTWIVPFVGVDWAEWPMVLTVEWDGTQWMIVSTSQDAVPNSPFKPEDNNPENATPVATP